jgi:hypothetical protein
VKKIGSAEIKNEIGRIFKEHNILEYKSPGDEMSIDDYFKGLSYACLYKSLGKTVDDRQAAEITVSLFREERPEKLFESLKELGATIEEKFPGIYYVKGIIVFDTQIIVTKELDSETHSSLRILSRNAKEEDARRFLGETEKFDTQGDKENAEAILQVSISTNRGLYEKLKEEFDMCQALQELMKDEIDERVKKEVKKEVDKEVTKAVTKAVTDADIKKTAELTNSLMESLDIGLDEAMDKLKLSENDRKELRNRLCSD